MEQNKLVAKVNAVALETDKDGRRYVPLASICKELGVDLAFQQKSIEANQLFAERVHYRASVGKDGKVTNMLCMPLELVYGWILTIEKDHIKPEMREDLMAYREECHEVLTQNSDALERMLSGIINFKHQE